MEILPAEAPPLWTAANTTSTTTTVVRKEREVAAHPQARRRWTSQVEGHAVVALLEERYYHSARCAKAGDVEAMTRILDDGAAEVDQAKGDGTTFLFVACETGPRRPGAAIVR